MRHPFSIRRALPAGLLLLGLALPASAAASPLRVTPPPGGESLVPRIAAAVELGQRRFGPACASGIAFTWESFEVSYAATTGVRAWARAFPDQCRIEFNRGVWDDPEWRAGVYDWPWLCTLVVHEYGHLAGRGHVEDPNDVMHATIERVVPECAAAPEAGAAGRAAGGKPRKRASRERQRLGRDSVRRRARHR
jgi:hypothetical protein